VVESSRKPLWAPLIPPVTGWLASRPLPADSERLVAAVAERYRELLPADVFEVQYEAGTLRLTVVGVAGHRRATLSGVAETVLRAPLPMSLRVRLFLENEAASLQEFVSKVLGRPWPAAGAAPRVRVSGDLVSVWYGPSDEPSAVLRWRPFTRGELGI
jgi:hypothetical protein